MQTQIIYAYKFFSSFLSLSLPTSKAELPLEFPDGTTPVTCRVSIYDSSTGSKVGVGSMMDKACTPPLPAGSLYMEEVHVKVYFGPSHVRTEVLCSLF